MDSPSLADDFHRYFTVALANTEYLKDEAYKLRYRVYCEEFGFEPATRYPDQRERDEFDPSAYHGLVIHKVTDKTAACLRLVPASVSRQLPFEKHCHGSYDRNLLHELRLARYSMCEISRLSVDAHFRRRKGEESSPIGQTEMFDFSSDDRRSLQLIAISSFMISIALSEFTRRRDSFAMMQPFLYKMLSAAGIPFFKIGKTIDYHGKRALYYTRTENALVNMKPELRELYQLIYAQLAPHFIENAASCSKDVLASNAI